MQIERIFFPTEALGPGKRLAVWTIGCSKGCPQCMSQELWNARPEKHVPVAQLFRIIKKVIRENEADGITISGGDPLEQREELLQLVAAIHPLCDDILVYTGFTLKELEDGWTKHDLDQLQSNVAVLIDGRYVDALNDNMTPLIGSTNQVIRFFDERQRGKYEQYCREKGRSIQNIYNGGSLLSIGIHNKV